MVYVNIAYPIKGNLKKLLKETTIVILPVLIKDAFVIVHLQNDFGRN